MRTLAGWLRIGSAEQVRDAVTRSHLSDDRVVGWYGPPGVVIDAELYDAPVPPALAARFGAEDFWRRWTATECAVKRAGTTILEPLAARRLDWGGLPVVWLVDRPAPGVLTAVLLPDLP